MFSSCVMTADADSACSLLLLLSFLCIEWRLGNGIRYLGICTKRLTSPFCICNDRDVRFAGDNWARHIVMGSSFMVVTVSWRLCWASVQSMSGMVTSNYYSPVEIIRDRDFGELWLRYNWECHSACNEEMRWGAAVAMGHHAGSRLQLTIL